MPVKRKGQKKGAETEPETVIDTKETEYESEDSQNSTLNKSHDDDVDHSNAYSVTTESGESDQSPNPGSPQLTRKNFSLFNKDVTDNVKSLSKQDKTSTTPKKEAVSFAKKEAVSFSKKEAVSFSKKEAVSFSKNDVSLSENDVSLSGNKVDIKSLSLVSCVFFFAFFAFVLQLLYGEDKPASIPLSRRFEKFGNDVDDLRNVFLNQDKRFWRTVKSSGRHVLNVTEPEYPAVLLFITNMNLDPQNKMDASSCLARKISQGFNIANEKAGSSPVIDCDQLDRSSQDGGKLQFDEKLRYYLDGNYKAVVVDNLERLSPKAALLLHGICDGDNAPYKDVMIILVLHTDQQNLDARSGEDFLRNMWERELESDKVGALMSRVANNAVVVNSELKTLESTCR